MEYIRNKVDPDIRNQIEEQLKTDKIHSAKEISINRDSKDSPKNQYSNQKKDNKKKKRFITIDGVKSSEEKLSVEAEKAGDIGIDNCKGRFLDVKK